MGAPFSRYGASAQAAVEQLLTDACQRSGSACRDLAAAYESGYFGPADLVLARGYYEHGAEQGNRSSWEALARLLSEGLGGPVEKTRAYFWLSLEARCVDPRSLSGQETWKARERLAASLGLDALEYAWQAVDAFMADYYAGKREIYFDPFLGTAIQDDLREEGKREADKRERRHRESLRKARSRAGAE